VNDPRPQDPDWKKIAARIREGDSSAEEEVAGWFARPVRAYALAGTGETRIADEITQETLIAVLCSLRDGRVQQPSQLPSFVLGTTRNLVNDHLRARAREKLGPLEPGQEPSRPAREHESFERIHAARQAIARLEPHERAVLMLSLVEDLGPEQIGRRLGLSADAVRQRKSRALRRLSEMLRSSSQTPRPGLLKE
jgi:RNA polymerase sigma factor (sigma-70 family)